MKNLKVASFVAGITSILLGQALGYSQDRCPNFEPHPLSVGEIIDEYSGAVLRIQNKDALDSGPGFLIDSINGYVLTAAHVVHDSIKDAKVLVQGTSPALPGKSFKLKLVLSSSEKDIAVLKVVNPSVVARIRAIDISLRLPRDGATLVVMGYPKLGDEPNNVLKHQQVETTTNDQDQLIEVRQAAFPGNSGGPLIDDAGTAIGICVKEVGVGAAIARYVPMADAEKLLSDVLTVSDRMNSFEKNVRNRIWSRDDVILQLKETSDHPSNLELYVWAKVVSTARQNYETEPFPEYFRCPIVPAYFQRKIDDAAFLLRDGADTSLRSKVSLEVAKRDAALGRRTTALQEAKEALTGFVAADDVHGKVETLILVGSLLCDLGFHTAASQSLNEANQIATARHEDDEIRADIFLQLGKLNARTGNPDAARSFFAQAESTSKSPRTSLTAALLSAQIYSQTGNLDAAEGDLARAATTYREAVTLYPTEGSQLFFNLGQVQLANGQLPAATDSFEKSLKIDPYGIHAADTKSLIDNLSHTNF